MKDIKTLMIGFLLATCMFLMMGQGGNDSKIGNYQAFSDSSGRYLLNTSTGDLFENQMNNGHNVWQLILFANH